MRRETVVSDVDQVIFPFNSGLAEYCNDRYGTVLSGDSFDSDRYNEVIGCSYDEAVMIIGGFLASDHREIQPLPGVRDILPELAQQFNLVANTSRNPKFQPNTERYISHWLPGSFCDVLATGNTADGGPYTPKLQICRDLGALAIIDDSVSTITECADGGVQGLMFGNYPTNQNVVPLPNRVTRVTDWWQVRDVLRTTA